MKIGHLRIAPALCGAILSGCGALDLCNNTCDSGWVHDTLTCMCMQTTANAGSVSTPGPSALTAECVCPVSNGQVAAWFLYPPSKWFSSFTAFSPSCKPGYSCDGNPYTGTVKLKNVQWTESTFANGVQYWFAAGDLDQAGQLVPNMTPVPWCSPFARGMLTAASSLPDNSIPTCIAACDSHNDNCFRFQGSQQIAGLKTLHDSLVSKPSKITPNDLMAMFATHDDPCHRGDTNIANGEVSNVGESCVLTAALPIAENLKLHVPELLHGQISVNGAEIRSDFSDPRTRATLAFEAQNASDPVALQDATKLTNRWGGDIKAVFSDGKKTVFSIGDKSCVRVTTQ